MNALTPFTFPETGQQVRTVTRDGEPWFVAKDACDVIGISKHRDAVAQLDDDERASMAVDTLGGKQAMTVVSEPGVYGLMLISRSPKVKPFRRWITHEVIPTLRKTGSYALAQQPMDELELAERNVALIKEKRALAAEVQELRPAADSWNTLAAAEGDLSVADAAKILSRDPAISLGRDRLFDHMGSEGWTFRQRSDYRWRASQEQVNSGRLAELPQTYEDERTGQRMTGAPQVRVTYKGLHELHRRLGGIRQLQITEGGDG